MNLEALRYPIGRFNATENFNDYGVEHFINQISLLPNKLATLVSDMSQEQLDTPYRESGWTVRQVIHHIADSHMNSYIRFRLALTEDNPTIKPYAEEKWALLEDSCKAPIGWSLQLIDALHRRWVFMLRSMSERDFQKTFFHPESLKKLSLREVVAVYAWHGEHHYEHINQLKIRMGW
ncbi:MAG: putative metal-dependent hydrolase [Saprospiraceae bacterium]|nr:putative metal-dependent hydrolase [Saprospiraceae bacterium]